MFGQVSNILPHCLSVIVLKKASLKWLILILSAEAKVLLNILTFFCHGDKKIWSLLFRMGYPCISIRSITIELGVVNGFTSLSFWSFLRISHAKVVLLVYHSSATEHWYRSTYTCSLSPFFILRSNTLWVPNKTQTEPFKFIFQDSGVRKSNRHLVRSSVVSRSGLSLEDGKDLDLNPLEINVNNIYTPWTRWSRCKKKCKQVRKRYCTLPAMCGTNVLKV